MVIGIILYCLIMGMSVLSFLKKRYVNFLLAYLALLTNIFMLDNYTGFIYGKDLAIFINFILLLYMIIEKIQFSNYHFGKKALLIPKSIFRDTGFIIISIWIGFYLFEFLRTVILGYESISYAFKVTRLPLLLLIYFPLRRIPIKDYHIFFSLCYKLTIGLSILFLLQFCGISLLSGKPESSDLDITYANNIPFWMIPYIFYIALFRKGNSKLIVALLFCACIFLTFVRSLLISLAICFFISIIKNWRKKSARVLALFCCLIFPVCISVIYLKSDASGSKIEEDIGSISLTDSYNYSGSHRGTFSFRLLMLAERIDYLLQNEGTLPLGIGAVHEDSPAGNEFNFFIGTLNMDKPSGRCQIESGDIAWVPISLRYGLVGIVLHLFFLLFPVFLLRKRKDGFFIFYLLFIYYTIISFATSYFERELIYFEYSLFLAILFVKNNGKCQMHSCHNIKLR